MGRSPSPRLASDKAPSSRESRAQPLIRQLQQDLVPTWDGPGADKVGLGPATRQLLSQTCLQAPTLGIEAVRSRELFFLRHQSRLLVPQAMGADGEQMGTKFWQGGLRRRGL